jgi:hypothetical protein
MLSQLFYTSAFHSKPSGESKTNVAYCVEDETECRLEFPSTGVVDSLKAVRLLISSGLAGMLCCCRMVGLWYIVMLLDMFSIDLHRCTGHERPENSSKRS